MAVGHFEFKLGGTRFAAQQRPEALPFFAGFFQEIHVDRIIEIGTSHGGLTMWLRVVNHHAQIISYDIREKGQFNLIRERDVDIRIQDVFTSPAQEELTREIQKPGRTLLLCDGGDKIREFNFFSAALKPGDIIMAHDYSRDADTYKVTGAIWPWWEIAWKHIKDAAAAHDLVQIMPESEEVVWIVMRKRTEEEPV